MKEHIKSISWQVPVLLIAIGFNLFLSSKVVASTQVAGIYTDWYEKATSTNPCGILYPDLSADDCAKKIEDAKKSIAEEQARIAEADRLAQQQREAELQATEKRQAMIATVILVIILVGMVFLVVLWRKRPVAAKRILLFLTVVAVVAGLFYWFQYRPARFRSGCYWEAYWHSNQGVNETVYDKINKTCLDRHGIAR